MIVALEHAVGQLAARPPPRAHDAPLAQPELGPHLQDERVDHAHAAHAADRGGEDLVVLLERPRLAVSCGERLRVGDARRRARPGPSSRGHDEVEGAHGVREGAELDARAVGRGRHHARDRLPVVAAHVAQRQAAGRRAGVELSHAGAGTHTHEPRLLASARPQRPVVELEQAAHRVRLEHEAVGQRDVRPRVSGPNGAHGSAPALGVADELHQLLRWWPDARYGAGGSVGRASGCAR